MELHSLSYSPPLDRLNPKTDPSKSKGDRLRVLIVDDELSAREGLKSLIQRWGFEASVASDGRSAMDKIRTFQPQVVLTDLIMPRMDAISLLKKLDPQHVFVILLTAQGSIESAVEAIKLGAYDYMTKPVDLVRLKNLFHQIQKQIANEEEMTRLRRELRQLGSFESLHGRTPVMQELFHQIELAAPSSASVLISGASGTGKELVARIIHKRSHRGERPFVPINCSAIPATLLESELFGHEKGAFTGAIETKEGCFELAHKGTIFLDEIASMALDLQSKILRVLENGTFRRVGGKKEHRVDARVIASSNIQFEQAIEAGTFRDDLYYRLNVFHLKTPKLCDRTGDIPLLASRFVDEMSKKNQKNIRGIHPETMELLLSYPWPGNVRELKNAIEHAVIVAQSSILFPKDLPNFIQQKKSLVGKITLPLGSKMMDVEKEVILRTLDMTGGNKTQAAQTLGISLKTIHNKLNRFRQTTS